MTPFANASPRRKAALITVGGLLGLLIVALLTGLIALAGLHQLRGNTDLIAAPKWLWRYHDYPAVRTWLRNGLIGSGLAAGLIAVAVAIRMRRPLHGAARWSTEAEIRREGLRAKAGILLGRNGGSYLSFGGVEHILLHAPTRSGKGVGVVIPNLLSWPGSVVVLDIKGENHAATAGFRAAHGQTVFLFDPLAPNNRTARFNPLAYIDRADAAGTLDELQKIAGMLFPVHEKSDPFWAEAARTGFIGVGAFVAETPDLPFTLGEIFRQLTQGSPKVRFPAAIAARAQTKKPLSPSCVGALTDFCSASENTFASIKQTITARMGLWLNPRVDAATSASDFDLRNLRGQKVSIYLGASPDNMTRVAPLYNLLFQQLVDLNTRSLPPAGDAVTPVLLLMDEFARLGVANVIAHGFSFIAGYGLRLLAVIQSPSQLRGVYGHDLAEEIVANCGVEVVFTPKELKIAQELSERLGYYTYGGRSRSWPTLLTQGRRTTTESDQRRALLLPQELMQMGKDNLLILRAGIPPVRGRKIVYYRDKTFSQRIRKAPAQTPFVAAPPSPAPGPSSERLDAMAADVAAIRVAVGDIQTQMVRRPMTPGEASGEAELSMSMISLAIEDVDMDELPASGAPEEEVMAFAAGYIDRVALDRVLDQTQGAAHHRQPRHHDPHDLSEGLIGPVHEHDHPAP